MPRRDFIRILIIGAAVGLLIQPILANNLSAGAATHLSSLAARIGIFLFFLVLAPLALWIAQLVSRAGCIARAWPGVAGLYQFAQFAAVGTLNSFIDVGVFNLETFFYGGSFISNGLFAAFKAVSFVCGTTNSFIWNKYWTFGASEKTNAGELGGFYGVAIVGWVLNVTAATLVKSAGPAGSHVWVNVVAPLAGIAVSFIWNFTGYKLWVFKKR